MQLKILMILIRLLRLRIWSKDFIRKNLCLWLVWLDLIKMFFIVFLILECKWTIKGPEENAQYVGFFEERNCYVW